MTMSQQAAFDELTGKIQTLSELAWDDECQGKIVERWLGDFDGSSSMAEADERLHALHLLSNFLYFGRREVDELLRSLYRDILRYDLVQEIRRTNGNTLNIAHVNDELRQQLEATRFVPLGHPSASPAHLLYRFRQVNDLSAVHFALPSDLLRPSALDQISKCIFIDDFAGTGKQAVRYAKAASVEQLRQQATVEYHVLVATDRALNHMVEKNVFDHVRCVIELTDDYRAFSRRSLYYTGHNYPVSKSAMKQIAKEYGRKIGSRAMGFGDSQLVLGFSHNVPNNTLPIFWFEGPNWHAPFPRHRSK